MSGASIGVLLDPSVLPSPQVASGDVSSRLLSLRARYNSLADRYGLRRYRYRGMRTDRFEEAQSGLQQLLYEIDSMNLSVYASDKNYARVLLLQAVIWTGIGRLCRERDEYTLAEEKHAEATEAFAHAVKLFSQCPAYQLCVEKDTNDDDLPDQRGEYYGEYALALHFTGAMEEAEKQFLLAIDYNYRTAEMFYFLGLNYLRLNNSDEAERCFDKAANLKPDAYEPFEEGARIRAKRGQSEAAAERFNLAAKNMVLCNEQERALRCLEEALALENLRQEVKRNLLISKAQALHIVKRYEEAIAIREEVIQDLRQAGEQTQQHTLLIAQSEDQRLLGESEYAKGNQDKGRTCYERALETLKQVYDADASSLIVLTNLSLVYHLLGQHEHTIQVVLQALEQTPEDSWCLTILSLSLAKLGRYSEALEKADLLLAKQPENITALVVKGQLLHVLNKSDQALEILELAARKQPQLDWVQVALGDVLRTQERFKKAHEAYDAALNINPDNLAALENKGLLLLEEKNDQAATFLRRALEVQSGRIPAMVALAAALRNLGNYKEAKLLLENAFTNAPDNIDVQQSLLALLFKMNCDDELLVYLDKIIKAHEDAAWAWERKGQIWHRQYKLIEARKAFEAALRIEPTRSQSQLYLSDTLRLLGRYEKAKEHLDKMLERADLDAIERAEVFAVYGDLLRDQEKFDAAENHLKQARELAPDIPWIQQAQEVLEAHKHLNEGAYTKAISLLQKVIEQKSLDQQPEDAECQYLLGHALLALHDKDAISALETASRLSPDRIEYGIDVVWAYYKAKKDTDAIHYMYSLLTRHPDTPWLMTITGELLCSIGFFAEAELFVRQALKVSEQSDRLLERSQEAFSYETLGWCLDYLGDQRREEALAAHEHALALSAENSQGFLWRKKNVADALHSLGKKEEASVLYVSLLDVLRDQSGFDLMALRGWCSLRLTKYEDATSCFLNALRQEPEEWSNQFDLALTLLCDARDGMARSEYKKVTDYIKTACSPGHQYSLLTVAYQDYQQACTDGLLEKIDSESIKTLLEETLEHTRQKTEEMLRSTVADICVHLKTGEHRSGNSL